MPYRDKIIFPKGISIEALEAPKEVTNTPERLTYRVGTIGLDAIGIWLSITLNDSTKVSVIPMAVNEEHDDNTYNVPTMEIHTGVNKVFPKRYELQSTDAQQSIVFQITTSRIIPYIDIYVYAETVGATPATIDSMVITVAGKQ